MSSSANKEAVCKLLEAVPRPHESHLTEAMREIEGGALEDIELGIPGARGVDFLHLDALLEMGDAERIAEGLENEGSVTPLKLVPVDLAVEVGRRDEDVEARFAVRSEGGIGHAGIADVEGDVIGGTVEFEDLFDVLFV